jgi:hypothetical protein
MFLSNRLSLIDANANLRPSDEYRNGSVGCSMSHSGFFRSRLDGEIGTGITGAVMGEGIYARRVEFSIGINRV